MNVEDIILTDSRRGMDIVRLHLKPGYCRRAAELLLSQKGVVLIGTGFPVKGTFETDGPIGAIALYLVLEQIGVTPVFVCAPPISGVLKKKYRTHEFPISSWQETEILAGELLERLNPYCIVSIERPGITGDGCYYNMKGENISDATARFDLFFKICRCRTVAVGDGGNEIGMGNIAPVLDSLNIHPSVTCCDELVVSTVSNWGVYGIISEMSRIRETDYFTFFNTLDIALFLRDQGSVDGVTAEPGLTEDGFSLEKGTDIIRQLKSAVGL